MSIPRELRLVDTPDGARLRQTPVVELETLRGPRQRFGGGSIAAANAWLRESGIKCGPLELSIDFEPANDAVQEVKLLQGAGEELVLRVDRTRGLVFLDRTRSCDASFHPKFAGVYSAPLPRPRERVRFRIFVDACSVETFVNDGQVVLTALAFPGRESDGIELTASSEAESVIALQAWRLSSKLSK